jgi:hypothetical protein
LVMGRLGSISLKNSTIVWRFSLIEGAGSMRRGGFRH